MKKIICLLLALVLSAAVLVSCDDGLPEGLDASTEKKTEKQTTEAVSNEPIRVDGVGGKNAKQLLASMSEYMSFDSVTELDFSIVTTEISDDVISTSSVRLKLSGDNLYVCNDVDGEKQEVWLVDGDIYVISQGVKAKCSDTSFEDFFGSDWRELIEDSSYEEQITDEKLNSAEIMFFGGQYYFQISYTPEEAEALELPRESCTMTFYFDTNGIFKKAVQDQKSHKETVELTTLNKPVKISPPSDASEYSEVPVEVSKSDYQLYAGLLDKINSARGYYMVYTYPYSSETYFSYWVDRYGSRYCSNESPSYQRYCWCVNGVYYEVEGYEDNVRRVTDEQGIAEIEEYFAMAEMYQSTAVEAVPRIYMSNFSCSGSDKLSFSAYGVYYSYVYSSSENTWELSIADGTAAQVFYFMIDDSDKIEAPI